jgi:threonine dehydratase
MSAPQDQNPQLDQIDFAAAAERVLGVVKRTPLVQLTDELLAGLGAVPEPPGASDAIRRLNSIELYLKLECLQETGSFKSRGAWNQIAQLTNEQRLRGVVTTSSGNHGRALAWAAQRAGVQATICMPQDAYANKIEACRELGADVRLGATRPLTDAACLELAAQGAVLVHPYDAIRTIEGTGTVALEILEDLPGVDLVVAPVGGGGLISGVALALQQAPGKGPRVVGVEPRGAATMSRALEQGAPVDLPEIQTQVQGLCPLNVGALNVAAAQAAVECVLELEDEPIFAAQALLVNHCGLVVEPAGAATLAAILFTDLLDDLAPLGASAGPLRVTIIVSGGNPAPDQLEAIRCPS